MSAEPSPLVDAAFYVSANQAPGEDEICGSVAAVVAGNRTKLQLSLITWFDVAEPGSVTESVVRHLAEARVVIANLTGNNSNVYYEVGVAHSFLVPVICVTTKGDNVKFDLQDQRRLEFDTHAPPTFERDLLKSLTHVVKLGTKPHTAVGNYLLNKERRVPTEQQRLVTAALKRKLAPIELADLEVGIRVVDTAREEVGTIMKVTRDDDIVVLTIEYAEGRSSNVAVQKQDEHWPYFYAP